MLLLFSTNLFSQQMLKVSGKLVDSTGASLEGASIKVHFGADSLFSLSQPEGDFYFQLPAASTWQMHITMLGFLDYERSFKARPTDSILILGHIRLIMQPTELEDVVVTAQTPVKVMEDTTQYAVSAFKVRDGAMAEEIIKKLPGLEVDKDGNITAQGKAVKRVRVNGKDFFGGDVQTATQNLPAEILDNIQIIEDYGDQANLTGIKAGEPETIININTRKDRNQGKFGTFSGGVGTKDRYMAGAMYNIFRNEQQITILGSFNNTNVTTFNFNGGGRGGGARGRNVGSYDRGGNAGNGLTRAISGGVNYRDRWGEKVSVYGSYSLNFNNNQTASATQSNDINLTNNRTTNNLRNSETNAQNHRLTFNLEYRMDTANFLKLTPYFSYSQNDNRSENVGQIKRLEKYTYSDGNNRSKSYAPSYGGSLMFNHKFKKRGRNFSTELKTDYSARTQNGETYNQYRNIDSSIIPPTVVDTLQQQQSETISNNLTSNVRVSYTEPLDNKRNKFLEASYEWNRSANFSDKDVFDLKGSSKDPSYNLNQSNELDYQFTTHKVGLTFKGVYAKYNYLVGLIAQPSFLSGETAGKDIRIDYRNMNWLPTARFVYNFDRNNSINFNLGGRSREPGFNQLQPIKDSSNLNNIIIGNPDLTAETSYNVSVRYNKSDRKTGKVLFANLTYDLTDDKIVAARFNNPNGTGRTTTYRNTDGFYRVGANGSFTQPFKKRIFSTTAKMDASYDNNISFTDNFKNKGQNWNLRPGLVLRMDIPDIIDLNFDGGFTFYKTVTRYDTATTRNDASTLRIGISSKHYFFKDLTIGYDISKNYNWGFGSVGQVNPLIINVYAEYRFLKGKAATVRLQAYDLLDQNTGIYRTVNETTITDVRTNRLSRFYFLSFSYRLFKFKGTGGSGNKMPASRNLNGGNGAGGNRNRPPSGKN